MKAIALATSIIAVVSTTATSQSYSKDRLNRVSPQATTDPQIFLYRFSGVQNTADVLETGRATTIFCTNHGNVPEYLRVRLFQYDGPVVADRTLVLNGKITVTLSTHQTEFAEDAVLADGIPIFGGHGVILGTTASIGCSAMIVKASDVTSGIALHMTRYNPLPGSTE